MRDGALEALLPFGGSPAATALQRSRESAVHVPERFRAVAPSAVLVKGLSPDSSYREWGGIIQKSLWGLKRKALIYLVGGPPVAHQAPVALAARPFRRPPHFDQLRNDRIAVIALNFNEPAAHRAAGSAA